MNKKELSKGFTGIEINGVRFSNIKEMLIYMNKQRVRIINLENENAELDCQKNRNKACYSCANATERCFRNEIACPCQKYKSYKEENAELKTKTTALENANRAMVKELDDMTSGGVSVLENVVRSKDQLTKAKEIIKKFLDAKNIEDTCVAESEAEHFLQELSELQTVSIDWSEI